METGLVGVAADLYAAEVGEVWSEELHIEQGEATGVEALDKINEGDLGGVGAAGEHGLAEEGAAKADTVKATKECISFRVAEFDRMSMAACVQVGVELLDEGVNPCVFAARCGFGAGFDSGREILIEGDVVVFSAQRFV